MTRTQRTVRKWLDTDWETAMKAWRATEKALKAEGRPLRYREK